MSKEFVLARGRLAETGRIEIVAAHDGRALHSGVVLPAAATFEIMLDADPRAGWLRDGIREIAFVLVGARGRLSLEGADERRAWRLEELPLLTLELKEVAARPATAPQSNQQPLGLNTRGLAVAALQSQLVALGYTVPAGERDSKVFGAGTRDAVRRFQAAEQLAPSGAVDTQTYAALQNATLAVTGTPQVEGRVLLNNGTPAQSLKVRLYGHSFGSVTTLLEETTTDTDGYYTLAYRAQKGAANLELRAVDAQGAEVSLSNVRFNARTREVMNLVAPSSTQISASEYARLQADLKAQVGAADLAKAREDSAQRDVTLLHQATQWDARLVALAAAAASASATTNVPAEAIYALYRAGLPTDPAQLARASVSDVTGVLTAARVAGVISLNDDQIAAAKAALTRAAPVLLQSAKAPGALSTFGELIDKSGLSADQKSTFTALYLANPDGGAALWNQVKSAGFSDAQVGALQLQGKLAYLTVNNAALTASLSDVVTSPDAVNKLADAGFYEDAAWTARLNALSGNDATKLTGLIPPAYHGDAAVYAADLARRVRLSFPTQTVTRMIETDGLVLGTAAEHATAKTPVSGFLRKALTLGFELGEHGVEQFAKKNQQALFDAGTSATVISSTLDSVKRLQRLYQLTPSNDALKTLYALGFQSAQQVSQYSEEEFVERFGGQFIDPNDPPAVSKRSQQISQAAYSFFTLTNQLSDTTTVYGISASEEQKQQTKDGLIEQFPTMEQLLGPLDFCACEDCRSVLSPAAYLVDLLHFLDPDQDPKPIAALSERRPDLLNLPLTCENTNTVMPYIDIVNEILEYFVINSQLAADSGHDTGNAQSDDLISEPQNILTDAYDNNGKSNLRSALYPLGLPFQLWLETVRRFFGHFNTPFWQLLDLFRSTDVLFPDGSGAAYFRASVFAEYLGISPPEYQLFTNAARSTNWFQLYGESDSTAALADLPNAKTLSQRLGVSYEELVSLVQTWFVNPGIDALIPMQRFGVSADQLYRYNNDPRYAASPFTDDERAAFNQRISDIQKQYSFDIKTWIADADKALVLADTGAGCDFSNTLFQYGNGKAAEPLAFVRLNLFVRLWRKLGWTIDELDQALRVFWPTTPNPVAADTDFAAAMQSALVYLALMTQTATRLSLGSDARLKLLALWGNISTKGQDPLYAELFLVPSVLKLDSAKVFDSVDGNYLPENPSPAVYIADDQSAVQAALNLTSNDIQSILAVTQYADTPPNTILTPQNTSLTLSHVSTLYRYGVLASALQLSVADLITLIGLSGKAPFTPPAAAALTSLGDSSPLQQTLEFLDVVDTVKQSGFTVEDVAYLWKHQFDPVGKYRDDSDALLSLVQSLAGQIDQIISDNQVPSDPAGVAATVTDDWVRQRVSLLLPSDVAETFLGMWTGTIEYSASAPATAALTDELIAAFAGDARIEVSFDGVRNLATIAFRGVLVSADESTLVAKAPVDAQALAKQLLDEVYAQAAGFFSLYLVGTPNTTTSFFTAGDFDTLFASVDATDQAAVNGRRAFLADALAPFLTQKLIRQAVLQILGTTTKADPAFVESLVTDPTLLQDPAALGEPLIDAFIGAAHSGLTASYYSTTDISGSAIGVSTVPTADTSGRPAGSNSARFDGVLEVPADGAYRFFAELADANTQVELHVGDAPDPLILQTAAGAGETSQYLDLRAGVPYAFTFIVRKLGSGNVSVLVEGEALAKGSLSRLTLYPAAAVARVDGARILLGKVLQIAATLQLDEVELREMLSHAADFDGFSLNALPVSAGAAAAPFKWFLRLAAYARLKRDLQAGPDDLVAIFQTARRADTNNLFNDLVAMVATLTRRTTNVVSDAATQLGFAATANVASSFASEVGLARLWITLQMAQKVGFPPSVMAGWAVPDPGSDVAHAVRDAVKSRYDTPTWRQVAQSIFDPLRQLQRDALVAFVMQKQQYEDEGQIFEHFLVDPGMEPVVQTSRLRLAVSSVQTFVQRCLLGLEPEVKPSAINAGAWNWMKRYRVWQANREIFLFPENWLEPEFRDDKTHLYQALEAALLQGDVTDDFAQGLFYTYLQGLEQIARLQIMCIYMEQPDDRKKTTVHVVGRTHSAPYDYYYRCFTDDLGSGDTQWSAWQPITAQIDGDNLAIAVWRQRVHVFWVTFLTKTQPSGGSGTPNDAAGQPFSALATPQLVDAQLSWTEYFQGKWTPRASSGYGVLGDTTVSGTFDPRFVRVWVSGDDDSGLKVNLGDPFNKAFFLRTRVSLPQEASTDDAPPYPTEAITEFYVNQPPTSQLYAIWNDEQIAEGGFGAATPVPQSEELFAVSPTSLSTVSVDNFVHFNSDPNANPAYDVGPLLAPFFLQDDRNTFFVMPDLTETTIEEWDTWVITVPGPDLGDLWKNVLMVAQTPQSPVGPDPDPEARFAIAQGSDWLANSTNTVKLGDSLIGEKGLVGNLAGGQVG